MSTRQRDEMPAVPRRFSSSNKSPAQNTRSRRRRTSSLGADPRGDTGAQALATTTLVQRHDRPNTPDHTPLRKERGRKRKKAKNALRRYKRLCLKHTWLLPLTLLVALLSAYFVYPSPSNPLHYAIYLSYADPPLAERTNTLPAHIGDVTQYGKGPKDFAFVAFYTIVFSFTREFLMQRVIRPIAISCGIRKRAKQYRFMEQFYTAVYFFFFGPLGLYVMSRTPVWYFNIPGMYEGFPHRAHDAWFKAYYLLQAAYWLQQWLVLLLELEAPRKDYKELVLHHVVTLSLIGLSYRFHFAYMGIAVYVTHDISDFFLATSKCLNYITHPFTGPYFATFMLIWAYTRHYLNLRILYSLLPFRLPLLPPTNNEFATVGSYTLDWDTQQYKCWISHIITFGLLATLQAVNLFWYFLIVRILARYLRKDGLADDRSEDEGDGEEDGEKEADAVEEKEKVNGHLNGNGKAVLPHLAVNGQPVDPEAETNVQAQDRRATLRKR